ncbi:MAG TPA: hypothetical protein VH277_14815 [Gemmatimonadaceae bacterium]|jgi:hypothetical protein|nr:hypothetical protein [Gemmatimonadaceae bacterium]
MTERGVRLPPFIVVGIPNTQRRRLAGEHMTRLDLARRQSLLVCSIALMTGCVAQRPMFQPTPDEKTILTQPPLDLTVAVRVVAARPGMNAAAYARPLETLLTESGAFRAVVYDPANTAHADLIVESTGDYCNSAIIPLLTIVTVGIVPTIWTESQCTGARFLPGRAADSALTLHIRGSGRAVMGLFALPLGLFPGWSFRSGVDQPAYQQKFRLEVFRHRDELLRLAGRM